MIQYEIETMTSSNQKYAIHAYQFHLSKKKRYSIGSLFSFPIQTDEKCHPLTIDISPCTKLTINTIAIDPKARESNISNNDDAIMSLYYINDSEERYCLCPYLGTQINNNDVKSMVTNLNLSVIGPQTLKLALVNLNHDNSHKNYANIFGTIEQVDEVNASAKVDSKSNIDIVSGNTEEIEIKDNTENIKNDNHTNDDRLANKPNKVKVDKKRKLTNDNEVDADESSEPTPKLTKKERRKLAQQKAKELEEVISKQNGHMKNKATSKDTDSNKKNKKIKAVSLTKERKLSCGVIVSDIIHGTGAVVRVGRKVSINYVGKFTDTDKEFDKNLSKSHPLVFRLGTGEVIKGLDKGLEGMKVGGERVITIPPELGYGRKGSGKIPGDATLCFEVKLLSVGTK